MPRVNLNAVNNMIKNPLISHFTKPYQHLHAYFSLHLLTYISTYWMPFRCKNFLNELLKELNRNRFFSL